jgi:hypothetical protein
VEKTQLVYWRLLQVSKNNDELLTSLRNVKDNICCRCVMKEKFKTCTRIKARSHSMSGSSIWASFECHCCFWIAGGLVSYVTMWLLTLQLFKNSIDTQGKLRLNLHSLSVSELLEYGRWSSFYKALCGYVDLDISNYVSFINHDRSRLTLNPIVYYFKCRYVELLHSRNLTLIEQFIYGTQCVELLHLIAS